MAECSYRCGYFHEGQGLIDHERYEHARCPLCGREPDGEYSVSHKEGCPRLLPDHTYEAELAGEYPGATDGG